jgi:hypothetical protein
MSATTIGLVVAIPIVVRILAAGAAPRAARRSLGPAGSDSLPRTQRQRYSRFVFFDPS